MAILDRDGVKLHYDIHGSGGGTPLLLTHGYGASGRMWESNVPALGRDRPAITWDMRGHGSSDAPDSGSLYTHEACLEDMAALLDVADVEAAVLCGMSLGGFLSLRFRLRYPARVRALVLVDTGPGFRDSSARERWNKWARAQADDLEARGAGALLIGREQGQGQHVHGIRGIAHAARGMLVQDDSAVLDALREIDVPTLIIVGSEDTQFLVAAEVMEARIPGARRVVLEGAGHAANIDAPEEFNAIVSDFLEALEGPAPASVQIKSVDPQHPDARYCLAKYVAELNQRCERGFDPSVGETALPHEVRPPAGEFFVAYLHGEAVGCGAVKHHVDGPAEIKRMWISPLARGRGLGRRLLERLEMCAREGGARVAHIETNAVLVEALSLYRSSGWVDVPAFNQEPFADHWLEKSLS